MLGRTSGLAVILAGLAALPACTCGGRAAGPAPERFVPAGVDLALVVPEAARAARELAALHEAISGFPGAAELVQARGALAAQLGFDPLDPDGLAGAGVDARRGAAVASFPLGGKSGPPATLLVLPVRDADKLSALFARIARERLGAAQRASELRGGVPVVSFATGAGAPPALAYVVVDRTALLSSGAASVEVVAAAAARKEAESLGAAPSFKTARAALGDRYAAILFAPPGSRRLAGLWPVKDGLAVGTTGGTGGVRVGAAVLLGDRAPSFRALAAAGGAAASAVARLDPAAPLALRWDGDPAALGRKLVPMLAGRDRARLAARGLDAQHDLFDLLAPGAAAVLSVPPNLDLAALSEDAVRDDPLLVARFEAVLPVKDPAAAVAVSERLVARPRRAPAHGPARRADAAAEPSAVTDPAAPRVFRIETASGEIAWRVDPAARRVIVAGGGLGALDALEARLAGGRGFEAPTHAAAAALEGGLGGAVLDPQKLVASVRALPDEAFGSGPSGFVVRSVVGRFLDPAARLSAVSLRADLAEGALVLALDVEARPGGER